MTHRLRSFVRSKRALTSAGAMLCYALAVALAPSGVRSQLDSVRHEPLVPAATATEAPLQPVAPSGDAFAPRAQLEEERPPGIPVPLAAALPRLPGSQPLLRSAPSAPQITAIAIGMQPSAILESGGTAHVVTIGDDVGGSQITGIAATYVQLANGRRLSLEPASGRR